ncbi:helix-turn-helix domain-containing protein [Nocardia terpenica]|uniref:Helix-turn-helix domain-containing protein n=1 Tax=Nocardia terpenica TaxID=455432 RepID=A0A6G9YY77_9NOCA|nr:helix-turn-helix transcriptional regulator [Nocardia terpenica]QIS18198.1 helix-turn-helix domain-containing protein [Nocardia terpenica]
MTDSRNVASLRSQWLGQRLRDLREAAGISLTDAAEYLGVKNASTMSRYETGVIPLRWTDVDALLTLYGVADEAQRSELIDLAKEAWRKGWWDEYRDVVGDKRYLDAFWLESRSRHIKIFSFGLLHGLLQTPAYMDAVFRDDPTMDEAARTRATELRHARQRVITEGSAALTVIVHETILRQKVADSATTREQLAHLLELGRCGRVTLRVIGFDTSVLRAHAGSFVLFDLGEPFGTVAYVENFAGCLYLESPAVDRYLSAYDNIEKAAFTTGESAKIIKRAIEGWK